MFITNKFRCKKAPKYSLTVHYEKGLIVLGMSMNSLLNVKLGDRVLFYVSDGKAWIAKHEDGFYLRQGNGSKKNSAINNKYTTEQLKKIANPIISTVNYKVNPEPTTLQGGVIGYLVEIIK